MSTSADSAGLAQLVSLRERELQQVVKAMVQAREHAVEMQRVLDEQLALVDGVQRELRSLDARRANTGGRSTETLQLAIQRRRWLIFDLQKEEFYLGTMRRDVSRADAEVLARQAELRRLRARLDALSELGARQARTLARREERREAARLDDRPRRLGRPGGASRSRGVPAGRTGS